MKKSFILVLMIVAGISAHGQEKRDTIIVELANTSKVIFTIRDRSDIEILKNYNFNELFKDILVKLETNDTSKLSKPDSLDVTSPAWENEEVTWTREGDDRYEYAGGVETSIDYTFNASRRWGRTWQSFNFDFGTNNYLQDGKFPDSNGEKYSVRPWGSWYLAAASVQRTRVGKKFFLEWSLGMSWYTFKFQDDDVLMQKTDDGVTFVAANIPDADYKKSKLSASYVMASLVPVVDFGDNSRKARVWEGYQHSFRIGLGPYIGYRIGSHSKLKYKVDGDTEKDKDHDSFYLNNIRYGARLQVGFRSTDLFFNYDINELFSEGKGPKLNAFSFGVIF